MQTVYTVGKQSTYEVVNVVSHKSQLTKQREFLTCIVWKQEDSEKLLLMS